MFKIFEVKGSRRKTHIAKGVRGDNLPKTSLCGNRFKRTAIVNILEGNIELCTCQKCINIVNANLDMFYEKSH